MRGISFDGILNQLRLPSDNYRHGIDRRVIGIPSLGLSEVAVLVGSIPSTCDSFSRILSGWRDPTDASNGLEGELSNFFSKIDRLKELMATIRDSIQKQTSSGQKGIDWTVDRLDKLQVLEKTMAETIAAAEQLLSAGGLHRISTTMLEVSEPMELQLRVEKVDACVISLRQAASVVLNMYSQPDRPLDKVPRGGRQRRIPRRGRPQRIPPPPIPLPPLRPRPAIGEPLGNAKYSSQGWEDGNNDGPGSGDVSKVTRCGLAVTTVASSSVMAVCDHASFHSFLSRSVAEKLGLPIVDVPSMVSVLRSPATLVIATATTAMALTMYHYLQRDRRHQDPFIASAVAAGVAGGWLYGLDGTSILLRVAPWCALLGMLMGGCSPTRERQGWGPDEIPVISEISKRAVSLA